MRISNILVVIALVASASPAAAATVLNFAPSGSSLILPVTKDYSSGGLTVTASGFSAAHVTTALYGKNEGTGERGLGLANDPHGNPTEGEISFGKGFVQIDVSKLLGNVSSISFLLNSVTQGEQWSVFGSNTDGAYSGAALFSGTSNSGADLLSKSCLSKNACSYYDFVSTSQSGGQNFLLSGLTMNSAVPEPGTWMTMLLGFGLMGVGFRRRRPVQAFAAA